MQDSVLPPISYAELYERLSDPDSDLDHYLQYLVEMQVPGRMGPEMVPDPTLVTDIPPTPEGGALISLANGFMRRRRHRSYRRRLRNGWTGPRIVSEGDSWFQYPTRLQDIIDHLMHDHAILSLGAAGDELSDIQRQREILFNIRAEGASALLLSAGGNDLFDNGQLGQLVEEPFPGVTGEDLVGPTFEAFLQALVPQYLDLFRRVHRAFPDVEILIHGYGPAFPRDGSWIAGPLTDRGVPKPVQHDVVKVILRRFNETLDALAERAEFHGRLTHIDVTDIGTSPGDWHDEIHLDGPNYARVAEKFRRVLQDKLAMPVVETAMIAPTDAALPEAGVTVGDLRGRFRTPKGAPSFDADHRKDTLARLDEALARSVIDPPDVPVDADGARKFRLNAEQILEMLGGEEASAPVDEGDNGVVEAIVLIGPRPSVCVRDGTVDLVDPRLENGDWVDDITDNLDNIHRQIAASGRIILGSDRSPGRVFGSAWMLEDGRVATAQHVLEAMSFQIGDEWSLKHTTFFVDFGVEADRPVNLDTVFRIDAINFASPDVIALSVDPAQLDAAVLTLVPRDDADFPDPLPLASAADGAAVLQSPTIFNVGYPKAPEGAWLVDTDDGNPKTVSRALLHALIGDRFGVKRLSPGMIDIAPGLFPGDAKEHVITHEATTLGGSSGSGLMAQGTSGAVMVGLHFAGLFGTRNYAHWVPAITDPLEGGGN